MNQRQPIQIRPEVLSFNDVTDIVPAAARHPRLVRWLFKVMAIDKVNRTHSNLMDTPGTRFATRLLFEDLEMKLKVDGQEVLDNLPPGAFITISNHPFGALDGVTLIHLFGSRRPSYKVMVNMLLNKISALSPSFIAVDQSASADPEKRRESVHGIRQAMRMLSEGEPVGFFPAGAMSKINGRLRLQDRPWQKTILQIIYKAKVPVIPVFFHGTNSWLFNILGVVWWQARSALLPREIFRKRHRTMHVSVGRPISVEEQAEFPDADALGRYLRQRTYALR